MSRQIIKQSDMEERLKVLCELKGLEYNKYNVHGSLYLNGAYGGWQVAQCSNGGGITSITSGFVSKREMYEAINNMIKGATI